MPGVLKTLDVSDGHSLASFEGSGSEGQNDCPKRYKLLLLDSLLQEVCIESGSCQSQPSLFRAKESPLKRKSFNKKTTLKCVVKSPARKVASCWMEASQMC